MPYDVTTGIPLHVALDPNRVPGGRLFPLGQAALPASPPVHDGNAKVFARSAQKQRRNESQAASIIGAFALYPTHFKAQTKVKDYIGKGCSGRAKFCQHQDGSWYVVKIVRILRDTEQNRYYDFSVGQLEREAFFLKKLGRLKAFYSRSKNDKYTNFYLIQEWSDGEMLVNAKEMILPKPLSVRISEYKKLVLAVLALNDMGISHEDLNAGNIIRKHDGSYELIDFGNSYELDNDNANVDLTDLTLLSILKNFFSHEEAEMFREGVTDFLETFDKPGPRERRESLTHALTVLEKQLIGEPLNIVDDPDVKWYTNNVNQH